MAREGKKLELYEILAAKRAKGKMPLGLDPNAAKQANTLEPEPPPPQEVVKEEPKAPAIIIDDAISPEVANTYLKPAVEPAPVAPPRREIPLPPPRERERERERQNQILIRETPEPAPIPEPRPEPRPRSPREVVFSLETALIFFSVVFALVVCSYYLGYKRGQEEKPAGPAVGDIENATPDRINLSNLEPAPRPTFKPPEQDYTLLLRAEPATETMPERLEMELAEAVALGTQKAGFDIQGFIFRSEGNAPQYYLTVGLGRSANDPELDKLRQIYNRMDGITLSRVPTPYLGCRIAPIRELGASVY